MIVASDIADEDSDGDLTSGTLLRPMFRIAWPLVVLQLLQVAYNVVDTFWLGAYSTDAVGALSLAFPLIFLLISIGGGFTAAGAILVAQNAGGETGDVDLIAGQTVSFVTIVAVVLAAIGYVATDPLLALLPASAGTQAAIVPLAADYMRIFVLGIPFLFGFFVFLSLLRGYGNTRAPMRVMFISVVVNLLLDPLLIFGVGPMPQLGIEGAAVATVGSRALAAAMGFYALFHTDIGPDVRAAALVPRRQYVRQIARLGVPTAVERSASSLAMISLTVLVVTFPPAVVTAYGLGNRLISLAFLPAEGLGQATDTIVGQNLGAGDSRRAERAVWIATGVIVAIMLGAAGIAVAFPELIVETFLAAGGPGADETIAHSVTHLRFAASMFAFMGVLQIMLGAFRGAGNTRTAMAFSILTLWGARVPVTYALVAAGWGPTAIWTGLVVGDVVGALAATAWFTRGTWKEAIVDADRSAAPDAANDD